jgi:rare lipoprotein A
LFLRLSSLPLALLMIALTMSCARNKNAKPVPSAPLPAARPVNIGDSERGVASWYGHPYHGKQAANGEVFDMNAMTAAHRTMPFGTWLKVDNETNGKSVNVRITDRGPFVANRIIDLSRKAAEEIAMIGPGTAPVKLTVIETPRGEVRESYGVQVGALESREEAERMARRWKPSRVVEKEGSPKLYRVVVGDGTREQATELMRSLRAQGQTGFVTRHVP